jgi:Fe-S cluster biogenesis protein NfuA
MLWQFLIVFVSLLAITENYEMETTTLLTIYAESTPNPATMKFVVNKMLLPDGKSMDFPDPSTTQDSPLASQLFQFTGVAAVFITANFVTVTKTNNLEWTDLIPILKTFIKGYIESGEPIAFAPAESETPSSASAIDEKIKELLDEYIRPAVEEDGGAISFKSFDNGVVTVILQGSCSGCPSSTLTLKAGIENLLKRMLPEVTEVVSEAM